MSAIREATMQPLSKEFRQPDGFPDTPTLNARVSAAVARLQVRGVVPQPNPLITAWQVHALIKVLARLGLIQQKDMDDIAYFTAWLQMQDLERMVDERPTSSLLVPTAAARPANSH